MMTVANIDIAPTPAGAAFSGASPFSGGAPFHVMLKPRGAICNLDCTYCFYLDKEQLYPAASDATPAGRFRMSDAVLETYTRQYIKAHPEGAEVTFAWQGGEPTLMGLDFFRRAIELQEKYRRPGQSIANAFQTNGTLLDDEWCKFFHDHNFLIGLSMDGPQALHDRYRVDKGGRPTWAKVMEAARLMQAHQVEFNILCCISAANANHPLEVYHFFRDELRNPFIQFIPIVEKRLPGDTGPGPVTERSVTGRQYGDFMIAIFDEWVRRDVGRMYVQVFDVALGVWAGYPAGLCVFDQTCGRGLALEHNGDLYSCDHFVEPGYLLGNIGESPLIALVDSSQQRRFGEDKRDSLPRYCRECSVRFMCNGECPKNRVLTTPDGEPGLNWLCEGLKAFFTHIDGPMRIMAQLLRADRAPAEIMRILTSQEAAQTAAQNAALDKQFAHAGRNDPCPCGSGKKFKQCHGRSR
jgi:uncharacterized protein